MRQNIFVLVFSAITLTSCKQIVTSCIEIKQTPEQIRVGLPIDLSGLCSQNAARYDWLIAETYPYTGGSIKHTFNMAGQQDVMLTVSGEEETVTRKIRVNVLP